VNDDPTGPADVRGVAGAGVTADTLPEDLGPEDLVLLGWPVGHSRSPAMHGAAAVHLGLPLRYRALAVHPDDVRAVLDALGRRGVRGANVTVPHKLAVIAACDVLTAEARLVGAVNTLTWDREGGVGDDAARGRLEGHNTDAVGLEQALVEDVGDLSGRRALLVGTGGAARAAAVALTRAGARVAVAGRDPRGCAAVLDVVVAVDRAGGAAAGIVDLLDDDALVVAVRSAELVMNATSVGLHGERLPAPLEDLHADQVAYDLVYGGGTPFLAAARASGAAAHDGLGMLVHQAAAAFTRWTGAAAPVAVMRDAAAR
jgi:shikimate dehydrogenase